MAVQAFGINDRGQVVGYLSPGGVVGFPHAFMWEKGKFTDLGTLPRTNLSFANAVNEKGQVVGQSINTLLPGTSRAFSLLLKRLASGGSPHPGRRVLRVSLLSGNDA